MEKSRVSLYQGHLGVWNHGSALVSWANMLTPGWVDWRAGLGRVRGSQNILNAQRSTDARMNFKAVLSCLLLYSECWCNPVLTCTGKHFAGNVWSINTLLDSFIYYLKGPWHFQKDIWVYNGYPTFLPPRPLFCRCSSSSVVSSEFCFL